MGQETVFLLFPTNFFWSPDQIMSRKFCRKINEAVMTGDTVVLILQIFQNQNKISLVLPARILVPDKN